MKHTLAAFALIVALPLSLSARDHDDSTIARFDGGIGVQPVSGIAAATGLPTPNVVRGVSPAGAPWVIRKLKASIESDGEIRVEGRGLLLAGGNNIGSSIGAAVRAVLLCGNTAFSTNAAGVVLDPAGDFRIHDQLNAPPPSPCDNPVLLIVSAGNGRWFAAGIPDLDDDN